MVRVLVNWWAYTWGVLIFGGFGINVVCCVGSVEIQIEV